MCISQHTKVFNGNGYPRFDIRDYVKTFIRSIREKEGRIFKTGHYGEVEYIKELLNTPRHTDFKSIHDLDTGIPFWNEQKVDCVPSNLGSGRGSIFYFICNGCRRRVKHLYEYSPMGSPLCRVCCRLDYEAPPRKARILSKLLRKPYLTTEDKQIIIQRAGITIDDIYYRSNTALNA